MKKLLLVAVIFTSATAHSQTLITAGKLEGTSTNKVRITESKFDYNETQFVAGTFIDQLDTDLGTGTNLINSSIAGGKNPFIASYNFGSFNWVIMPEVSAPGDSLQIDVICTDFSGTIYIGGTIYGTVDFDPTGGTSTLTSSSGGDAFFAKYASSTGGLIWASLLTNTGNTAKVVQILPHIFNPGEFIVFGYHDGTIDLDPTGAQDLNAALGTVNSFHATYDEATGQTLLSKRLLQGNGSVFIEDAENDFTNSRMSIIGTYDTDLDVDPSGNPIVITSNGSTDIWYGQYDANGNIYGYMGLGGTGTDRAIDVNIMYDDLYITGEFSGTVAVDPYGSTGIQAVSNGGKDIFVARYEMFSLVLDWRRTFGNAGLNNGFFAGSSMSETPMPQIAPNENELRGGMPVRYTHVVGMDFSGSMDANPSTTVNTITSSNGPTNAVVIELDSAGNYLTHYLTEGKRACDFYSSPYGTTTVLTGEFIGTNVDIMPYDSIYLVTHTTNVAGFITVFDRCMLTGTAELASGYPCGTCDADLICNVTGAIGPVDAYWIGAGVNGLIAENVCPGSYSCEVYDYHGCYTEPPIYLMQHSAGVELDVTVSTTPSSCGNSYGSATGTAVNPIGGYSFFWSNGDTSATADSLAAGYYSVNITDSTGCYATGNFFINDVNGPSITLNSSVDPSCAGGNTGSIDVTVTGGAAPLSFLWSNGATTEDLTNVGGGTYALIVTDANGCQSQICVTLAEPTGLILNMVPVTPPSCGLTDGSFAVYPSGGVGPYTFLWGATAGNQTNDTAISLGGGIYSVLVTDAQGCSLNMSGGLSNPASGITVYNNYYLSPSCLYGPGFIDMGYFGGSGSYFTYWSNGELTEDISVPAAGKYVFAVYDNITGCTSTYDQYVSQLLPNAPNVCMVTVDSVDYHNVVVYDKTNNPDAAYFKIYREGFCDNNLFGWVGSVDADSLSVFNDTVVNTETRSWRYYVTTVDTCGFESLPSGIHRTIHLTTTLTAGNDIQLDWSAYLGDLVDHYDIYRIQPTGGQFDLIDSISGIAVSYVDSSNLSAYTIPVEYFVEATPVNLCYATRAFNQNDSRSNRSSIMAPALDTSAIAEPVLPASFSVYPNPTNDVLNIVVAGNYEMYQADIVNAIGQTLKSTSFKKQGVFSTRDLSAGMYFVRIHQQGRNLQVIKVLVGK